MNGFFTNLDPSPSEKMENVCTQGCTAALNNIILGMVLYLPYVQLADISSLVATFHSELPVIISGSEDGTVKIWHSATFKLEQTLNYGLERAWCVSSQKGKQATAIGFDDVNFRLWLMTSSSVMLMVIPGHGCVQARAGDSRRFNGNTLVLTSPTRLTNGS
jgi:WD40 repeat protein